MILISKGSLEQKQHIGNTICLESCHRSLKGKYTTQHIFYPVLHLLPFRVLTAWENIGGEKKIQIASQYSYSITYQVLVFLVCVCLFRALWVGVHDVALRNAAKMTLSQQQKTTRWRIWPLWGHVVLLEQSTYAWNCILYTGLIEPAVSSWLNKSKLYWKRSKF